MILQTNAALSILTQYARMEVTWDFLTDSKRRNIRKKN